MKIKIYILTFLFPFVLFAQEQPEIILLEKYTVRQVGQMAIFPGCEKLDPNDKKALTQCMSKELNKLLVKELGELQDEFDKSGYSSAFVKIRFVINKEGKIIQVQPLSDSIFVESNHKLAVASEKAFHSIASKIKPIQPALLEDDGTPVNLQFDLPITYKINDYSGVKGNWKEFVAFTMYDGEKKYEIRKLLESEIIKIYLMDGLNQLLVKTFENIQDLKSSEDFGKIFEENHKKGLMADRNVNYKQHIRIYYSPNEMMKYDVYSVNDGKETLREILTIEEILSNELYSNAVLR